MCKNKLLSYVALILDLLFVDAQLTEKVLKSEFFFVFPFLARWYSFEDTANAIVTQEPCCDEYEPSPSAITKTRAGHLNLTIRYWLFLLNSKTC